MDYQFVNMNVTNGSDELQKFFNKTDINAPDLAVHCDYNITDNVLEETLLILLWKKYIVKKIDLVG